MKYIPEVKFLTGGWSPFWSDKKGYGNIEEAINRAKELQKLYIITRVVQDDKVVWESE